MILFHVQHLLGTGHVQRVALICAELAQRGERVVVLSGGMPLSIPAVQGLEWVQLEPVRSRATNFADLVDADGRTADDALFTRRRQVIESVCARVQPRVVVIETYPFGRRRFGAEIDALLDCTGCQSVRPLVVCSVRDILQRRSMKREQETVHRLNSRFDVVLVHGDPQVIGLEASFSLHKLIEPQIVYTGYVAPAPVPRLVPGSGGEVVVSAGGGAAGRLLYDIALEAARREDFARHWRILIGSGVGDAEFSRLRTRAGGAVTVERNRSDFRELLSAAAVLVSQAGYNTVADILVTAVPSLLVPFEAEGETEQLQRARSFEQLGRCTVVREQDLDATTLIAGLRTVLSAPEPDLPMMDLGGIALTADWLATHASSTQQL